MEIADLRADPGPVEPLARYSLIVNVQTAKRLEFYPPLSLLRFAETV